MNKKIYLTIIAVFCLVVVSGCANSEADKAENTTPQAPIGPGMKVLPPDPEPSAPPAPETPAMDEPTAATGTEAEELCGIENCHGYEITCGPDVPDFCTEMYALGDFCRQYAVCEVVGGECALVPDEKYDLCVDCVKECETLGGEPAFECEAECRAELNKE